MQKHCRTNYLVRNHQRRRHQRSGTKFARQRVAGGIQAIHIDRLAQPNRLQRHGALTGLQAFTSKGFCLQTVRFRPNHLGGRKHTPEVRSIHTKEFPCSPAE